MDNLIKVCYHTDKGFQTSKDLAWPQEYDALIKDIKEKFELEDKDKEINLKVVTFAGDDSNIKSQNDLQAFIDDNSLREFKFYLQKKTGPKIPSEHTIDFKELIDSLIKENEKDVNVDEIIKDVFGQENYEDKLKQEEDKLTKSFNQDFEKSVNDLLNQKSKIFQENLNKQLSSFSKLYLDEQKETHNSILEINNNLGEIKDETEQMATGINEFLDCVQKKEIYISRFVENNAGDNNKPKQEPEPKKDENKNNQNNENNNENKDQGYNAFNPLGDIIGGFNNDDPKLCIKFDTKIIEMALEEKDAKFINIDVHMTNIGNKNCNNLILVLDENNSSNDVYFFSNSSNVRVSEITNFDFGPKETIKPNISLKINSPKPGQTYKVIIFVREKNNDENLSEPLEIIIKVKGEDPALQRQKLANTIYEEIKSEFHGYEKFVNKNEIINQLLNNDLNKEEITNSLKLKIKQEEEKQNNEKVEQIFEKLEFHNFEFNKNTIISLIKEKNFNKEVVQNWINEKVSEKIYEALTKLEDVDITKASKDEVLKNINDKDFNINEVKKLYPKKEENNVKPNPVVNMEEVDRMFEELDQELGVSGFLEEELVKEKIIEYKLDKEKVTSWVEETLLENQNN